MLKLAMVSCESPGNVKVINNGTSNLVYLMSDQFEWLHQPHIIVDSRMQEPYGSL